MKHTKIKTISAGILLAALFASAGCSKEDSVDMPSFEVTLPGSVFKVGEPVAFSLSGNPDIISFYSGEAGNAYEYKDKDRITPAEMTLSFTTLASSGTAGYPNPAMAPISYSTDFDGDYTEEGVRRATWTDISDNFKFPTDVGQNIPSGTTGARSISGSTIWSTNSTRAPREARGTAVRRSTSRTSSSTE